MPIPLRGDFDAPRLRAIARGTKDAAQTRRLLALAAVYDGARRTEAAAIGGVTRQMPGNLTSGIASLLPRRLPRRVRRPRSCQNHPVGGQRGDKLPTAIVDPTPTTPASAY